MRAGIYRYIILYQFSQLSVYLWVLNPLSAKQFRLHQLLCRVFSTLIMCGWSCSYEQSCHLLKTSLAPAMQLNCAMGWHRYGRPLALLHQIMTRRSCKNVWQNSQEVLLFLRYMLEVWRVFFCKSSQICTACKSIFFHLILGESLCLPFVWVTQMVLLIADWWSKWSRGQWEEGPCDTKAVV
jgi:hypothetical protein